jgi:hypothetical protein
MVSSHSLVSERSTRHQALENATHCDHDNDTTVVRIALEPIDDARPPSAGQQPCIRCGSYGFNIHQRVWKSIRDPQVKRIQTIRYRCKRCGAVWRRYGTGVGTDRQSVAIKQLSVFVYCLGLSYQHTCRILADLGCALSPATVRKNVVTSREGSGSSIPRGRPKLARVGPAQIGTGDGRMSLRIAGIAAVDRWLDVTIEPGPLAGNLRWQVEDCARWATERN